MQSNLSPNAAVQRPRDHVSSATHVHNEMAHVRRARADVSRSGNCLLCGATVIPSRTRLVALIVLDILAEHYPDTVNVAYSEFANSVRLIGRS